MLPYLQTLYLPPVFFKKKCTTSPKNSFWYVKAVSDGHHQLQMNQFKLSHSISSFKVDLRNGKTAKRNNFLNSLKGL